MTTAEQVHVYTVTELTRELRGRIEEYYPSLWVEGEVSNVRMPSSGHLYFTLKDQNAQIQAVFFGYRNKNLPFAVQDGMKLIVFGSLTVYEKGGNYQVSVRKMEPLGIGALQLAFEQLKKKLAAEGLFDPSHKRPIPVLPSKIGIITSPTGAALRDILNVLDRRFSNVHIILAPVLVQGDEAPSQIAAALQALNTMKEVEVIIVTRGGGSLEDLWAFNDERVARAIHDSVIPVISAVGHEIDWTISDFVADLRVPTPSAAAELVITKKADLIDRIDLTANRMSRLVLQKFQTAKAALQALVSRPVFKFPKTTIEHLGQEVDSLLERMGIHLRHLLERMRSGLEFLSKRLEALSPLSVLARGYSVTRLAKDGRVLRNAADAAAGEEIETLLAQGGLISVVKKASK